MVPVAGLEPARYCYRGILSPLRLPIPPHRHEYHIVFNFITKQNFCQPFADKFYLNKTMVGITNRDLNKLSNNEASSQLQCLQKELSDRFLQSLMNSVSQ